MVIDWNGFRGTFERRAEAILGQPVRITGDIEVTLLPSTVVTLSDVEVGDTEGEPMARIERLEMRLDLLPLLSGQYNVSELVLDRPRIAATVDDAGRLDWLIRPSGGGGIDPADIALDNVIVNNGVISFLDVRTGSEFVLSQINTNLFEAGALTGPWRMEGALICRAERICGEALPVSFTLASGRLAADGTMVVNAVITPASAALAGTLRTDGTIRADGELLAYEGAFSFDKLAPGIAPAGGEIASAWTIDGDFALTSERLALSEITWESTDGLYVVTGAADITLGESAAFVANLASRQIDLDRALGEDAVSVSVAEAWTELWARAGALTPPALPGRVMLSIPTVIIADSVLQEIDTELVATADHWEIADFSVRLPGQSELAFSGIFRPGDVPDFEGEASLSSQQPAALFQWWRGTNRADLGLDPFALTASLRIAEDTVAASAINLSIADVALGGAVTWNRSPIEGGRDSLAVDLSTERFDFDQLVSLARLFDADRPDTNGTDYDVRLAADALVVGNATARDVAVDAAVTAESISIAAITISDLDGASIAVDGDWAGLGTASPRGTINASLSADRVNGLLALAREIDPDGPVTRWLLNAAPALAPLDLEATLSASVASGYAYSLRIAGNSNGSEIRLEADTNAGPEDWAAGDAEVTLEIDAEDGVTLARQFALDVEDLAEPIPATLDFRASGDPATGMTANLQASFAGVQIASDGTLVWDGVATPAYAGPVTLRGDVGPLLQIAGVSLPNSGDPMPAVIQVSVDVAGPRIGLDIAPSSVLERSIEGELELLTTNGVSQLTGALSIEEVDLAWLGTLPLGVSPLPDPAADEPWSSDPIGGLMLDGIVLDLDLAAGRFLIGEGLTITNADLGVAYGEDEAQLILRSGSLSTGIVTGEILMALDSGQALLNGQLFMADVPLDALIWRSDGQPVAEGVFSISAEFDAIGRSPAALVSTLAGSGTLTIRQGTFHFIGADAFDQVVRLADEEDGMGEAELRSAFTGFLDAGTLAFGDADIPFDIAAGVVTPRPIIQEIDDIRLVIRAPVDLARLTIDSSWELSQTGGGIEDGPQPRAFVTFTGPIADPERQVNVAPLAGYLSLRRLRETEALQAEVLERERFIRIMERIQLDQANAFDDAAADAPGDAPSPDPDEPANGDGPASPGAPDLTPGESDPLLPLLEPAPISP